MISYEDYLGQTGKSDCMESWIDWKVDCCRMSYIEAVKAAHDPEWGYEP